MTKYLFFLPLIFFLTACSDENNSAPSQEEITTKKIQMFQIPNTDIINKSFSFTVTDADSAFTDKNEIISAINNTIKCTLTPKNPTCQNISLPKFILMEDESLQRPTQMQYKISKIMPLADGMLHVHTQSQCNNNWFGLCQGNIIYVLQNQNNTWYVSDIFALTSPQ